MTKSVAYIGVLALVVGVLLTTCVGSAWSMELLTDEQLGQVKGTDCPDTECGSGDCYTGPACVYNGPGSCTLFSGVHDTNWCEGPAPDKTCTLLSRKEPCVNVSPCTGCTYVEGQWYCTSCDPPTGNGSYYDGCISG